MARYHLIATPWRAGVTGGIVASAIIGFMFGMEGPSMVEGLVAGVIGGAFYGVLAGLWARRPLAPLVGLSAGERATAIGSVHRGLPTTDRRLAPAVVGYAETVLDRHRMWVGTKMPLPPHAARRRCPDAAGLGRRERRRRARRRRAPHIGGIVLLVPGWLARGAVRADRAQQSARALLD